MDPVGHGARPLAGSGDPFRAELHVRPSVGLSNTYDFGSHSPYWLGTLDLLPDRHTVVVRNYGVEVARFDAATGKLVLSTGQVVTARARRYCGPNGWYSAVPLGV